MGKKMMAFKIVYWLRQIKRHEKEENEALAEYARGKATAYMDCALSLNLISYNRWSRLYDIAFDLA